jgi:prepilin-type N-terminal cleavage/methylation domain-containing protein
MHCYSVGSLMPIKPAERGFTMVELAITILVMGMLFAFAIPAFNNISQSYQLKGATENIAAQIRMAREKAIANGTQQPMHFTANYPTTATDYHIHYVSGFVVPLGKLPRGISYYSIGINPVMEKDGRIYDAANNPASGLIILSDRRGNRDTVSIQSSGMVLTK